MTKILCSFNLYLAVIIYVRFFNWLVVILLQLSLKLKRDKLFSLLMFHFISYDVYYTTSEIQLHISFLILTVLFLQYYFSRKWHHKILNKGNTDTKKQDIKSHAFAIKSVLRHLKEMSLSDFHIILMTWFSM